MLVDIALLVRLGISDDTSGHSSGNLSHQHIFTLRSRNHNVGMLVLLTGLRQPRLMVVTVLVVYELHLSVHRKPVGMHVQGTHEDRDHQTLVVEVLVLLGLLHDDNLSISRGDHQFFRISVIVAYRTSVEIEHQCPRSAEYHDEDPEGDGGAQSIPQQQGDAHDGNGTVEQLVRTLAMDPDLLQFLDSFSH